MKPDIRFSVITAVLNRQDYVERVVESLLAQTWRDWEMIVQDGLSADGTLDRFAAYDGDSRISVVSEQDAGVYDAWNKALARARGDWILFLGVDDALADSYVFARAARLLAELGPEVRFAQAGLHLGRDGKVRDTVARGKAEIFRFLISGMPILTPAAFFRADLFAGSAEPFDPSYKIAGDFAFVAPRLRPDNLALLPFVAAYMETGGLSSAVKSRATLDRERKRVLAEIVKPIASDIVQYCIDTYEDTRSPLSP